MGDKPPQKKSLEVDPEEVDPKPDPKVPEAKPDPGQDPDQKPKLDSVAVSLETEGDMARASSLAPQPSWFTPKRLLIIFCTINLLNYVDRGAIASNGVNGKRKSCLKTGECTAGSGIQGDFNLSNFEDGVISSAFMVGLLIASPIFASLAKSVNPFRLIGVGLSVWTVATAACGFSVNFWMITIFRMLVGVGEASFISLAAPFIDDNAPVSQKTTWLGAFYMCIPTGVAVGYVYGGVMGGWNWRIAFWFEAVLMLPFAIFGFLMKPLQLKGFSPAGSTKALTAVNGTEDQGIAGQSSKASGSLWSSIGNTFTTFGKDMKSLLSEKVFVVNVLGYIAYNFVIGAYSYWGPKAGYNIYHMKSADYMFGGLTAICGVVGSLAGGFVLDRMTSTLRNTFKLLSAATFLGAIFCFGAFCFKGLVPFMAFFAVGQLLVFATQAPVNFVCLHCVKPSLRPLSMAISTVSIHIFGDVPSSPLVGLLQDQIHNWRTTALILTAVFFIAAGIWFIGIFIHSVDRFNEDSELPITITDKSNTTPLLEEKKHEAQSSGKP